jgi:hypothetical protein
MQSEKAMLRTDTGSRGAARVYYLDWLRVLAIPDLVKFEIIATSSFAIIMTLYEFLVRRFNLMCFLFGMKLLPKTPAAQLQEPASTGHPGTLPSA